MARPGAGGSDGLGRRVRTADGRRWPAGHVVEAGHQACHGRLARTGPTHQGHRLARVQVQVEVAQDLYAVGTAVGEVDTLEADVAVAVDEVEGAGAIDDGRLLVEDFVDAFGRGRGALAHHDDHPQHHEGGLEHHQVEAEGQDAPDAEMVVDHHPPAHEQHDGQPELGQVLHGRRPPGPQVGVLHVPPAQLLGRLGEGLQLVVLGGEGLDDSDPVHVFIDDRGDVGQPGLDEPGDGEQRLPHPYAGQVDERHRDHADERQRDADAQHEDEGDDGDRAVARLRARSHSARSRRA